MARIESDSSSLVLSLPELADLINRLRTTEQPPETRFLFGRLPTETEKQIRPRIVVASNDQALTTTISDQLMGIDQTDYYDETILPYQLDIYTKQSSLVSRIRKEWDLDTGPDVVILDLDPQNTVHAIEILREISRKQSWLVKKNHSLRKPMAFIFIRPDQSEIDNESKQTIADLLEHIYGRRISIDRLPIKTRSQFLDEDLCQGLPVLAQQVATMSAIVAYANDYEACETQPDGTKIVPAWLYLSPATPPSKIEIPKTDIPTTSLVAETPTVPTPKPPISENGALTLRTRSGKSLEETKKG